MSKHRRPDPDENDDFEIVEDEPPRKKKRRPRAELDEDDEEPLRPRYVEDEDEQGDDAVPVRAPKKKKKKRAEEEPAEEPAENEWIIPLVLMGLGLILTLVGTIGAARHPDSELSAGAAVAFRLIGQVIAIPITIVALVGIGTVMGIEYGTLTSTIRNLAAMGLLVGGLLDVFDWLRLPWFVYQPIMVVLTLGLLMSLFGLDVDEAMATMVGLNLLGFLLKMAMFLVVMMIVHKAVNKPRPLDPDRRNPPGWVDPGDDGDPDDDDDPPKPKGKGPRGGKGGPPKPQPQPPVNPPFDPDE